MGLLYTKMKIFHFQDKINSLPKTVDEILPPIHIRIKPTNVCNHNCSYCAYRVSNQKLGKDMRIKDSIPKDKMMEIIDDLEETGVKAVTFSGGGEPFCYPHLSKTVKKLSQTHIRFACLTNGSKLKGEIAEVFAHHGTWIRISIDGWDGDSYSAYRGVSNDEFSKVMTNLENFSKLDGKCYLGVSIIVDLKNSSHIFDLIKKLKNTGVNSAKIAPCIVSNDGITNNEYHKPIFNIVKEQICRSVEELSDERFEIFDSYHAQLDTFKKDYEWCPYIQVCPVIGADCNIYSCHDKAYNLDEGLIASLKEQRFKDIWFSGKNIFFKINPSLDCDHHCMVDMQNKMLLEYLNADNEHVMFA